LKADARIFNLAITNGDDRLWIANTFAGTMARAGRRLETMVLDERSSEMDVQKAIEKAKGADVAIASLYGRVRTGQVRSVGLPEPGARALSALISSKRPIIGLSFGNPYLLQSFPELRTYIVAYGDMPSLQQAMARAVLGQIDITGRLPISLPDLYPRGTGIQLKAQTQYRTGSGSDLAVATDSNRFLTPLVEWYRDGQVATASCSVVERYSHWSDAPPKPPLFVQQ
ncbi:MAG: hypothetical protein LC770_06465, partial [Acidobacteria bacterium]|nr:hypothetical protein [Acidobacteriota bacterium]